MSRVPTLIALIAFALPALADDAPFLGTDPASTPPQGEIDVQQWFTWAHGNSGQSYSAFQSQTEVDYALTDRVQLAMTLVYDWSRTRPPGGPSDSSSFVGLAAEAVYVALPYDTNPIGLAFAVDPAFNAQSRGLAFRVLLTKYFGAFENVLNINFDNDWQKDATGHWEGASGVTFNYGLGYALDEHWTVAAELGNEFAFEELMTSGRLHAVSNTFFAGPTIQYDCEYAVVSLGAQAQLPWSSGSGAVGGFTPDIERWRVALRILRTV